ncbi:MAG: DUF2855 family protein [Erythrobacter sp.]
MTFAQVQVRKADLSDAVLVESDPGPLVDEGVRLRIESFALTANNVTYAVVGDGFGYWNFFPPLGAEGEGHGVVPMWGHARVTESNHADIAVGERVYGYLPMATGVDVFPVKVGERGFEDGALHRRDLSPVYNRYSRLAADPEHDPSREAERMIFGPLFRTGFLIDAFMRKEEWFDAREVILTSASSKTALGLASVARENSPDIKRIGLTSERNVEFVEETGLFDKVHTYAEIGNLPLHECVAVDFAGNADVLRTLHEHFNQMLAYSCLVGATHVEARSSFEGQDNLPRPKPTLFFAPDHAVAFFEEHGPEEGGARIAKAWHTFLGDVDGTIEVERRSGLEAARQTYLDTLEGTVDPAKGIVIEP